jgi:hypothetical protein
MLTEVQLAARLNVSRSVLRKLRHHGGGPPYVKLGSARSRGGVRYPLSSTERWLEGRMRTCTREESTPSLEGCSNRNTC